MTTIHLVLFGLTGQLRSSNSRCAHSTFLLELVSNRKCEGRMRLAIAFRLFSISVLILVGPQVLSSDLKPQDLHFIDFHLHVHQNQDTSKEYLKREALAFPSRMGTFIISDGYDTDFSLGDLENIYRSASSFAQESGPRKFLLCGVYFSGDLEKLGKVGNICLHQKRAVGFKVREIPPLAHCTYGPDKKDSDSWYIAFRPQVSSVDSFETLLQTTKGKPALVLIHGTQAIIPDFMQRLPGMFGGYWGPCGQEEAANLIKIAERYPNVQFVIAHAALSSSIGFSGLAFIGKYYQDHPEKHRNIYLEISTLSKNLNLDSRRGVCIDDEWPCNLPEKGNPNIPDPWPFLRSFDINYVLYGTDLPEIGGLDINFIVKNKNLSDLDKEKILRKNGLRIIEFLDGTALPWR